MKKRKGILLAGGFGSRLYPVTSSISKQLLPVYDKPMIYYSLSLLMLAGITDILIISSPSTMNLYEKLLCDGFNWGISITYAVQDKPRGIAHALIIAEDFIDQSPVALCLGDNILYGVNLQKELLLAGNQKMGATIFGYKVKNPGQYAVLEFDPMHQLVDIHEKPTHPQSNYAVPGIYFYDNKVINYAKDVQPSKRKELEITDVNLKYLSDNTLNVRILGRGTAWFDAGTPTSMLAAANFVFTLEDRQGLKICCPEEIAWRNKYIDDQQFAMLAKKMGRCDYGKYLNSLLKEQH